MSDTASVTWWCWDPALQLYAVGSMSYCRFGRHGEHATVCGFKELVPYVPPRHVEDEESTA